MPELTEGQIREIAAAAAKQVVEEHASDHHMTDFLSGDEPPHPKHVGRRGDIYLNRKTGMLWGHRNGRWEPAGVIKGDPGEPGEPGRDGRGMPPVYAADNTLQTIKGQADKYHKMDPEVSVTVTVPDSLQLVVESQMGAQMRNADNGAAYQKVEISKDGTVVHGPAKSPHSETVFLDLNTWGNTSGAVTFIADFHQIGGGKVTAGDEVKLTVLSRRKFKPGQSGDIFTLFRSLVVTPVPSAG